VVAKKPSLIGNLRQKINAITPKDNNLKKKQDLTDIYETVLNRVPFFFKGKHYFYYLLRKYLLCLRKNKINKVNTKEALFQSGIEKLGKEFDIAQIATKLRILSLLSNVVLFKY
jgi:hypothetical protein